MRGTYLALLCAAGFSLAGYAPSPPASNPPPSNGLRAPNNERVELRASPPADSVVVVRAGYTILLSMRDVEAYLSEFRSPDVVEFRDLVRRTFAAAGHLTLGDGFLPDLIAARLVEQGKAAIRPGNGELLPYVELALEHRVNGTYVVSDRLIFVPDGSLLLRVRHSVTMS